MTDQQAPESFPDELNETQAVSDGSSAEQTLPIPGVTGPGSLIGPYQLLQLIGQGGMGEVWLAEQKQPVRRRVAIKLIKVGMDTREVVARFESERQALAMMDHPAIAKVFDAGSTVEGRPYFVMEYVAGQPITSYCDRRKLNMTERLKLFIQVCEGVQHAHQKAIIHRDLKPSNILVTEVDGKPSPRIIDFGVAKATAQRLSANTMFTRVGAVIGTLGYMSPEQASSEGEDIDTRSDVYSLGVVLYELLSGTLPFDFRKLAYDEVLKQLREKDAPTPSTRFRHATGDSAISAKNRGADAPTLVGQLRGDPDAITLKALEKDRARRYATPNDLAADVGRYLRNEPVAAHAPSAAYRARKYVRRHRLGVGLVSLLVLLLIAFAVAQAVELQKIRRERDRADRITSFMTGMFKVADPSESRGNSVTAREILDKSSNEIESGLGQDAEVRAQLMQVMSKTYENLGLYGRSGSIAERVLAIRQSTLGPNDRKTLEAMTQVGWMRYRQGDDVGAEKVTRSAIDIETRELGKDDPLTLDTRSSLAILLARQSHFVEMEKLDRELVTIQTRKFGAEAAQTLRSRDGLAEALSGQSRFAEAESEDRQILEIRRRTLGADHPNTLVTMHDFANVLQADGKYDEAEKLYRETLAIEERVLGPDHPDTASTMTTLANTIRHDHRRTAEADALYRKSLEIELRVLGPDGAETTRAQEGLGNALMGEGRYAEAETNIRAVLATRQRVLGPTHTDTLLTQYNLAEDEYSLGQYDEAEKLIRETLKTQEKVLDANDPDTQASKTLLAKILLKEHRPAEAAASARDAFDHLMETLGPRHEDTLNTLSYLGQSLELIGRYDEVRTLYLDVIAKQASTSGYTVNGLWYDLGCRAALSGHRDDAFGYLEKSVDAGYADAPGMQTDTDLQSLRGDPRFAALLSREKAAAAQSAIQTPAH